MRVLICIIRSWFNKNEGNFFGNKLKLVGEGREFYDKKNKK